MLAGTTGNQLSRKKCLPRQAPCFAEIGGLSLDQFGQESEVSNVLGV